MAIGRESLARTPTRDVRGRSRSRSRSRERSSGKQTEGKPPDQPTGLNGSSGDEEYQGISGKADEGNPSKADNGNLNTAGGSSEPGSRSELTTLSDLNAFPSLAAAKEIKKGAEASYLDKLVQGEGNSFNIQCSNPVFQEAGFEEHYDTDDDITPEDDDPECPTITLNADEKRELWMPWRDTLIIKLFDKGQGYMQLHRRLSQKWALTAPFKLIDLGNDFFIARFSNK